MMVTGPNGPEGNEAELAPIPENPHSHNPIFSGNRLQETWFKKVISVTHMGKGLPKHERAEQVGFAQFKTIKLSCARANELHLLTNGLLGNHTSTSHIPRKPR
jgi:hypothetical protein